MTDTSSIIDHRSPTISLIAAMAENRVIGREGDLPWHLPADLAFFKRMTSGHTVVMGRKTFDSVGKPLPGRRNIVLTRDRQWNCEGVAVAHDWDTVRQMTAADGEVFVLGGEQIYRIALPEADRVYLTLVHATVAGDARFPVLPEADWELVEKQPRQPDEQNVYAMTFCRYERRR